MDLEIILGFSSLIFAVYKWIFDRHIRTLQETVSRETYKEQLRHPLFRPFYEAKLRLILDAVDAFFDRRPPGNHRPLTLRGLLTCMGLSLGYSLALFILFWAFGGSGTVGAVELLPMAWTIWQRGLMVLALFGGWAVMFLSIRWIKRRERRVEHDLFALIERFFPSLPLSMYRIPVGAMAAMVLSLLFLLITGHWLLSIGFGVTIGFLVSAGALVGIVSGRRARSLTGYFALVLSGILALVVAIVLAVSGALDGVETLAIVGALVITLSGAVANTGIFFITGALSILSLPILFFLKTTTLGGTAIPPSMVGFFLFLGTLPIINGLLSVAAHTVPPMFTHSVPPVFGH